MDTNTSSTPTAAERKAGMVACVECGKPTFSGWFLTPVMCPHCACRLSDKSRRAFDKLVAEVSRGHC